MKNYKAVLFSPDGEYVTDFSGRKNIEDVWSMVANTAMGNKINYTCDCGHVTVLPQM